ncbi:MAG: DegT/DnrJ/EryC1/StrS family aminotransferase [Planctomycetaceae bacterium]
MLKRSVDDFACGGGSPLFDEALVVGRPPIPSRDALLKRIEAVLDSGHLTNDGPMVHEFEEQLGRRLQVPHVIAVCNGTVALQVMALAAGLTGEVIVPSMTFIATAHALQWVGLTPVFADVDPDNHTLDAASVERCINERTSAILGVHLWGNPCDVTALQQIAERHHLKLLFDASHAFDCEHNGRPIGGCGNAETFSFHATKVMHSIEGGAITTNDDNIAERCRLLRNFGIAGLTQIDSLGTNAKMNELSAAAGLTSLESLDSVVQHNQRNLNHYRSVVDAVPGLKLALPDAQECRNAQYVVVTVDETNFGLSRDHLLTVLRAEGVFARSYFAPGCHNAPPYAGISQHTPTTLPVTNHLLEVVLQLPTGVTVSETEIHQIGRLLQSAHQHAAQLQEHLNVRPAAWHPQDTARPQPVRQLDAA